MGKKYLDLEGLRYLVSNYINRITKRINEVVLYNPVSNLALEDIVNQKCSEIQKKYFFHGINVKGLPELLTENNDVYIEIIVYSKDKATFKCKVIDVRTDNEYTITKVNGVYTGWRMVSAGDFSYAVKVMADCAAGSYSDLMLGAHLKLNKGIYLVSFTTNFDTNATGMVFLNINSNFKQMYRGQGSLGLGLAFTTIVQISNDNVDFSVFSWQSDYVRYLNNQLSVVRIG